MKGLMQVQKRQNGRKQQRTKIPDRLIFFLGFFEQFENPHTQLESLIDNEKTKWTGWEYQIETIASEFSKKERKQRFESTVGGAELVGVLFLPGLDTKIPNSVDYSVKFSQFSEIRKPYAKNMTANVKVVRDIMYE